MYEFDFLLPINGPLPIEYRVRDLLDEADIQVLMWIGERRCLHCDRGSPTSVRIRGDSTNGYQCRACWEESENV